MALKGTLKDFGIADILQLIGHQQKTGVLHLKARDQETHVYFKDGNIVRAESASRKKKELIGNMLVRAELVTEGQLEHALETQRRTLKRLGDVMVSSRMVTKERFAQMVSLQTTETLYRLFSWKTGSYEFQGGEVEIDPDAMLSLRAESVLMEGFRMVDEWPVIKRTITSYELTFQRLKDLPAIAAPSGDDFDAALDAAFEGGLPEREKKPKGGEFSSVGENERRVYFLATPGREVRKLIDLSCLGEFETCKSLLNLVNQGYLAPVAPSGRTHAVGGSETRFGRAVGAAGRVAVTVAVLALLVLIGSRLNLEAVSFGQSAAQFNDPAAQRMISRAQMARIEAALDVYRLEAGELPDGLSRLVEAGLLTETDVRHPWRAPYHYRRTDTGFVLLPPLR